MGVLDETRFIETPRFFNGQRLFASDLQTVDDFNREMRWLHNKSLHQPGIGSGYPVYGQKGDREVTIGPGYALDSKGREIVLIQNDVEPVPPVASEEDGTPVFFDLVVSFPDDADLEEAETRDGVCAARGVVRLRERPTFCWVRLKRDELGNLLPASATLRTEIDAGLRIVLARAEVLECQLNRALSISVRRSARPSAQPYIACELVKPTPWTNWEVTSGENVTRVLGVTARIDTTKAGFLTTPCYNLRIDGPRLASIDQGGVQVPVLIASAAFLSDPTPDGFDVFVALTPALVGGGNVILLNFSLAAGRDIVPNAPAAGAGVEVTDVLPFVKKEWNVEWFGVEG